MKPFQYLLFVVSALWSLPAIASDPLLDIKSSKHGVSVTRTRSVFDYSAIRELESGATRDARIIVTTSNLSPGAAEYSVAEAFASGLKTRFPSTEFHAFGRVDNVELARVIRDNFDYAFVVGINEISKNYEEEITTYGSRTSAIGCSRPEPYGDLSCRETGTSAAPIGTRTMKGTIFTSIIFSNFGRARQVAATWADTSYTIPGLTILDPVGHVATTIRYGTSDASWCEDEIASLSLIAKMTGATAISKRPDKASITVPPSKIGCGKSPK